MRHIVVKNFNSDKRISSHCVGRRGYSPGFSLFSQNWQMHLTDADNWPSVPHAHSCNGDYKMNVWTGEVFEIPSKRFVGNARKKELEKMHRDDKFKRFAKKAIVAHRELYPDHHFTVPDWFMPLLNAVQHHYDSNEDEIVFFTMSVYIGKRG